MVRILSVAEPIRILVSFICTTLAANFMNNTPIVLAVCTIDLIFLTLCIVMTWFEDYSRAANCVLATYNVSNITAR